MIIMLCDRNWSFLEISNINLYELLILQYNFFYMNCLYYNINFLFCFPIRFILFTLTERVYFISLVQPFLKIVHALLIINHYFILTVCFTAFIEITLFYIFWLNISNNNCYSKSMHTEHPWLLYITKNQIKHRVYLIVL